MNHQKIYDAIIHKAKFENRVKLRKNQKDYIYYEKHHIIPRCLGGTNDAENLVLLTAKEHFVCHKLLTYIHINHRGIRLAYFRMCYGLKQKFRKIDISSRDYFYASELLHSINGKESTMYGKHHSKETKLKMSQTRLKNLNGEGLKESTKKKLSEALKGKRYPNRKPMSDAQKEKLRIAHIGIKASEETKRKMSLSHTK